jgi:hypothetical protein
MEAYMMPTEPAAPAEGEPAGDQFTEMAQKFMAMLEDTPQWKWLTAQTETQAPAAGGQPNLETPEKNMATTPGGSNTSVPTPDCGEKDKKEKYEQAEVAQKMAHYEQAIKDQDAKIAFLERNARNAVRERDLAALANEGVCLDVKEELADTDKLDDEAFISHKKRIVARYMRAPIGPRLHIADSVTLASQEATKEEGEKICRFAADNGITNYDEAKLKYRTAMTGVQRVA